MAKKLLIGLLIVALIAIGSFAAELPPDELQLNFSGYLDNFGVTIFYPSLSLTKQVSPSTSITGRYLVDAISAASMKSHFEVDGITSATGKDEGGGDNSPDELRHELGVGVTQAVGEATISLNTLYSTEHDYTSNTLAGTASYQFAKKNTTVQVGFVRSWDTLSPQIREWEADKDVNHLSLGLTQILSTKLIGQFNGSYITYKGLLSDPYQVVQTIQNGHLVSYEPIHPSERTRQSIGLRANYLLNPASSLQLGYRYYTDDWEVNSHTLQVTYKRYFADDKCLAGFGIRNYFQSRAEFYQESYDGSEEFLSVDSKLDSGYAYEYQFDLVIQDGLKIPFVGLTLADERRDFNFKLNFYHRHTDVRDWHSRYQNLYAYIVSVGMRYRF